MPGARLARSSLVLWSLAACAPPEFSIVVFDTTETFQQSPATKVDLLLVVDNSISMASFQQNLAANFDGFVSFFDAAGIDYQIGVVTTSVLEPPPSSQSDCSEDDIAAIPGPGQLVQREIITPSTPDPSSVFSDLVQVGTCGSGLEMGWEAALLAVTSPLSETSNAGFVRDDSRLSVLFVSDEDDRSPRSVGDYLARLQDVKGATTRSTLDVSALVATTPRTCPEEQAENAVRGERYIDGAQRAGGFVGDICTDDYADLATQLSQRASGLQDVFVLGSEPDPDTLEITIDGVAVPACTGAWSFDRTAADEPAVRFPRDALPPPLSQISVRYFRGTGKVSEHCNGDEESP